ncbi:membrane-spanning 4-domains subfamily A member 4A-like isoform X2 [Brachyhypopomus gauderio]|uniref:membrane-spanning 4-domains subfamily A member 4A-like isoform X2 n=1 Tax=Brachyhypopomus gauderio TaxID=698409 RepID=UPI00404369F6
MASTSIPMHNTGNGFTIVTHVMSQPTATAETGRVAGFGPLQKFLKAEPKALGTVQIMIGLMTILFGIVLLVFGHTIISYFGVTFWGSLCYIIAGSLTVEASNKLRRCVVKVSLVFNVLSTICAGISIILFSMDFFLSSCNHYYNDDPTVTREICGVLLLFQVLQFTISISISAFACKATSRSKPPRNIFTVVPNPEEHHPLVNPFPTAQSQQTLMEFPKCGLASLLE